MSEKTTLQLQELGGKFKEQLQSLDCHHAVLSWFLGKSDHNKALDIL